MHEINQFLNQLPYSIRAELTAHVGDTSGFTPVQRVAHHRAVAQNLIANKRSLYEPLQPGDEMASLIADMLEGHDLSMVSGPAHQPFARWVTYEIIKRLQAFINNLAPVQTRLEQEAHQRAAQAAQEAARIAAQRQAEEAERRRTQEEAARLQAQREAEAAARLAADQAARLLAKQQSEAAARAFAQRKAEEAALEESRMALALVKASMRQSETPAEANNGITKHSAEQRAASEIVFIPGPAAMAEIDRATLTLKHSIDAAVAQYASAIGPYLNTSPALTATAR